MMMKCSDCEKSTDRRYIFKGRTYPICETCSKKIVVAPDDDPDQSVSLWTILFKDR